MDYNYETVTIEYVKRATYKPDFVLPNGIFIETKGRFTGPDRAKHLLVRKQHPELDIRLLFMSNNKLHPGSKTRYLDWAEKNGFKAAVGDVPQEWLDEANKTDN